MAYLPPDYGSDARSLSSGGRSAPLSGIPAEWSVSTVRPPSQFLEYLHVIRGNLGFICLLALIGTGSGWLFATLQRPMYEARTVLDIRSLNENFLNRRDGSSSGTMESVLPESYVQTEIKILQSDSIRQRALSKLAVPPQPASQKADGSVWQSALGLLQPSRVPFANLIADAGHRIKVRAIGNTRIVEVLCDAQDGQLAASVCNTLSRTYIENNLESREKSTKETSDWLQSQLDDVRRRLTKAENDLKDAGKDTDLGFTSASGENPAQERLRQLQAELSRSQGDRIIKESNYTIAASRDVSSLPLEMDSGPIREYRLRLTELRRQLREMSATMTPEHYKVRELTMQIADVERSLQKERDDLVNRLRSDLEAGLRRESMVSAAFDQQSARVSVRDDKAVRYSMLKHDVDSERQLYETLLQKVGEVGLAAAMHTSAISVVDPAVAPLMPYSPNTWANVGVGSLAGSVLGLAFSLLRARSDRTIRSPGEASAHLQIRELGVIPSVRGRGLSLFLRGGRSAPTGDHTLPGGEVMPSAPLKSKGVLIKRMPARSIALATWLRVPEMSEAFFASMNSLLFSSKNGTGVRVIVMTSPEVGDGKTIVATNMAIALAQIGRRVVLVDGDLRKPRLHTIFDKSAENGLAKLLGEDDSIGERPLNQLVSETQIPNLYLIPTKPAHEGISTRLHSSRMRMLLEYLRREFDVVIIDSPPMLQISDARVLGSLADGVLLVFRARKTTKDAALAVHDCLIQDGIRVFGTILNDWNPHDGERYWAYSSYSHVA